MNRLEKYIIYVTAFLVPVVFSNFFSNFYDIPKTLILTFGVALLLLILAIKTILSGKLTLGLSGFDFPLLLLLVSYLVSAIFRTPNKMEAFFFPGTATILLALILFYFLINSVGVDKKILGKTIFMSGTLVAVFYLLVISGFFAKIPQLPEFIKNSSFSPMGGLFPQALFIAVLIPIGIALVLAEKEVPKKLFYSASLAVTLLALIITVYNILPGKPTSPAIPPYSTSWAVAVDSLKTSPLFGIGPGNYLTAFSRFRPLGYNATRLWAVKFTTASNYPLTLLAEVGLLGLAGLVLLYWKVFKEIAGKLSGIFDYQKALVISLILSLLFLALFPANIPLLLAAFVLLAANAAVKTAAIPLFVPTLAENTPASRIPAVILALPIIVGVGFLVYWGGKVYSAEYQFRKVGKFLAANEGKAAYDTLRNVIRLNPSVDRYRATYSQVNLALASAIAQKKDLTDADRTTIAQLIQQAIREGQATVTLNPQRAGNWEILARTYQAIMSFATGADAFTIQTYSQAVALDPTQPNLRIALGGVYYALGRFDDAIKAFELAVLAKPDLANGHYNLALAYREKGEIDKAIEQMNLVLSLVKRDSKDYEIAKTQLDNLEKRKKEKAETGETLSPPSSAQPPVLKPPLTLPEEATPPATSQ